MERSRVGEEKDGTRGPEAEGTPIGAAPAGAVNTADEMRGTLDDRPGPTWRGWVISILVAVILSAAATLLLGGSFGVSRALPPGACATGNGDPCCPPAGR